MTRHNKKRNIGLLYEFLVRTISDAVIEEDSKRKDITLSILRKHFVPGSELYKEFRLFHSLAETTVKTSSVADSILASAKKASIQIDDKKLVHEKSLLIRSINHKLNDEGFYNRRIPEYKIYATIQTLFNEWRSNKISNIVMVAEFEEQLRERLLEKKNVPRLEENIKADPLVEKIMIKKINEKYKNALTESQAGIIRSYIFSNTPSEHGSLLKTLGDIKDKALSGINVYLSENRGKDKYLDEKLTKAKDLILKENVEDVDDIKVEKFLDILKLNEEFIMEAKCQKY